MPKVSYAKPLAKKYERLFNTCEILPEHFQQVDHIIKMISQNQTRYERLEDELGIPWYFVAAIHSLECSLDFSKHLHNGDPLTHRTIHVPKNRPRYGNPPFTWEESAIDALKMKRLHMVKDWSLPHLLYKMEEYNGWGYRLYHPYCLSPYLWSFTNHYTSGKYVSDGRWSDTAKSRQCGGAAIIKRLEELEIITLKHDHETYIHGTFKDIIPKKNPLFFYSLKKEDNVKKLQRFLNEYPGISLRIDGIPGPRTSLAVKKLFIEKEVNLAHNSYRYRRLRQPIAWRATSSNL